MGSPGSAPYNFPGTEDGPRRRREGVAAVLETRREEQQRTAPAQLNVVPMTPPVEATLRILLNSVPYLIGAAVVRHPAVGDAVAAETEPAIDPQDEQDDRDRQVVEEVARAIAELTDARSMGRVLRDAVTAIAGVDGFSVSLFNSVRREVAYRYKVVGSDPDSAEMGRQAVDDGPDCYAARRDRRWHAFAREIGIRGPEGVQARKISVLQYPLDAADEIFGIATLQVFGDGGFSDHATRLVARVVDVATDRLAAVRRAARFQPSPSPHASAAAVVLPPAAAAPSSSAPTQPRVRPPTSS